MIAPLPANESERLEALRRYQILDTPADPEFDDFTALATYICDAPISLISLVDEARQWFKSKYGISATELPRDIAFCAHTILGDELMEVPDAREDKRFCDNPLVNSDPNIRFYAGAPLVTPDGYRIGSLCVIDRKPRHLKPEQREALGQLGRQLVRLLELRRQQFILEQTHSQLREVEGMRDSLVQMVVHDMRSQLNVVTGYLQLLTMHDLPLVAQSDIQHANDASDRLLDMICSLLDVSRLEAGEMPLNLTNTNVQSLLQHVIQHAVPNKNGRPIKLRVSDAELEARCDRELLSRVVQNLLGNALKFTDKEDGRIEVAAEQRADTVVIAVRDNGPGIPPEHHEKVFDKFFQVQNKATTGHSSGLGLAFCRLATEAHGGQISVSESSEGGAAFTVEFPMAGPPRRE